VLITIMNLLNLFFCQTNETDFHFDTDAFLPIIFYTRDISHGRGQRDLTYAMIVCLYRSNPELAACALRLCASKYGAWCDIKYFCRYVSHHICGDELLRDEMIDMAIDILVHQLNIDYVTWTGALSDNLDNLRTTSRPIGREILSYAAKWVPREKSAMGWLFDRIVERWAAGSHYNSRYKREFRKMISELNRELGTVEIKQCSGEVHNIMYEDIPIKALVSQYRSFANLEVYPKRDGSGSGYRSFEHICKNLVKIALSVNDGKYDDMLNHIWSKNRVNYMSKDIVPIVDISSASFSNKAIGIGILIAQNSSHGRLILSEHHAHSILVRPGDSFTSIIDQIRPFLSGVTDSRLDLAVQMACDRELGAGVVVLSQSGNRHTQTFWSPIFYWFFDNSTFDKGGAKNIDCDYTFNKGGAENIDCDYTYCDSMYMLSHYANGGTANDYISMVLGSDRYNECLI
jgi:hypothetical protein